MPKKRQDTNFFLEKDAFQEKKFQNWLGAWPSAVISGGLDLAI